MWRLSKKDRGDIVAEWDAQIAACVRAGINPTHLDSHHHLHTLWALTDVVIELARKWAIPRVRLHGNLPRRQSPTRQVYAWILNLRVMGAGLSNVRWFGAACEVHPAPFLFREGVELMVHPRLDGAGRVVDYPGGSPLDEVVRPFLAAQ